ncbi:MAG: ABC transporter substrate-binding protein [Rhodospirillaceae bacterium]|nr:ABC transporter substrate-binding protein [Rhodospirillaceae bacterium]
MRNEQIILYENLRACSYTPFYLAQIMGLFEEEGINIYLKLSPSPPETAQGLIEGRADVSFGGPMRVLMHHNEAIATNNSCPLVCFGQVVARDPFILIGRTPNLNFSFHDLVGPSVGVAIDVPTPWMTLQDDLSRAGIDPASINRAKDASMRENALAFKKGSLDIVQVFEPYAEELIEAGGHIWHSFSARGDIAFTTFYSTKDFVAKQRSACKSLIRAMNKSLRKLHETPELEIANIIGPKYFPELKVSSYENIIRRYKMAGLWPQTTALPVDAFVRLKASLLSGGLIQEDIPYNIVIDQDLSDPEKA